MLDWFDQSTKKQGHISAPSCLCWSWLTIKSCHWILPTHTHEVTTQHHDKSQNHTFVAFWFSLIFTGWIFLKNACKIVFHVSTMEALAKWNTTAKFSSALRFATQDSNKLLLNEQKQRNKPNLKQSAFPFGWKSKYCICPISSQMSAISIRIWWSKLCVFLIGYYVKGNLTHFCLCVCVQMCLCGDLKKQKTKASN